MSSQEILLPKQIIRTKMFPLGMHQLRKLMQYGELKKKGTLPEGINYIEAVNLSTTSKNKRWGVSTEEISEWQKRAKIPSNSQA